MTTHFATNSFNNKKVDKFVLFNGFIKLLMVTLDWGGEWLHVDVCCTHSADVGRLTSPHQDFWNKKPSCFQYNSSSGISENILIPGEVASLTSWCNVELSGCSLLSRKGHEINKWKRSIEHRGKNHFSHSYLKGLLRILVSKKVPTMETFCHQCFSSQALSTSVARKGVVKPHPSL